MNASHIREFIQVFYVSLQNRLYTINMQKKIDYAHQQKNHISMSCVFILSKIRA